MAIYLYIIIFYLCAAAENFIQMHVPYPHRPLVATDAITQFLHYHVVELY